MIIYHRSPFSGIFGIFFLKISGMFRENILIFSRNYLEFSKISEKIKVGAVYCLYMLKGYTSTLN